MGGSILGRQHHRCPEMVRSHIHNEVGKSWIGGQAVERKNSEDGWRDEKSQSQRRDKNRVRGSDSNMRRTTEGAYQPRFLRGQEQVESKPNTALRASRESPGDGHTECMA